MENLKDALEYIANLGVDAEKTEVLEINGRTYANKQLRRYDERPKASAIQASTLTSLVDYIHSCSTEFPGEMLIHIVSPTEVRLMSELDRERERETLFQAHAETSEYRFNEWYDQESFMIAIQANFQPSPDLEAIMKLAGNVEKKNDQTYSDDGVTQVATMQVGVAAKASVVVPNPVELIPYRTFQEIEQPMSKFVFRIGDKDRPAFRLIEAEGGLWKCDAVKHIKQFLSDKIAAMDEHVKRSITIIG